MPGYLTHYRAINPVKETQNYKNIRIYMYSYMDEPRLLVYRNGLTRLIKSLTARMDKVQLIRPDAIE